MKKAVLALAVLLISLASVFASIAQAQDAKPLLLRQPTLSRIDIAFMYGNDLWKVSRDGGNAIRLTAGPGIKRGPHFSPDGQWIAFTSARRWFNDEAALHRFNGQPYGKIYVMRADGSDVRQLTEYQFEHGTVAFVPLGNRK